MKIVEIKEFVEKFSETEAELATRKRVPDLDAYNITANLYNTLVIDQLKASRLVKLDSDRIYKRHQGKPPHKPRHLFKISRYKHEKYGDVWCAYVSSGNPPESKYLSEVLIIIKESDELKIAREYTYSNCESDGLKYKWKGRSGYRDLNLDNLGSPVSIERYQEPSEDLDGLKHYNADM